MDSSTKNTKTTKLSIWMITGIDRTDCVPSIPVIIDPKKEDIVLKLLLDRARFAISRANDAGAGWRRVFGPGSQPGPLLERVDQIGGFAVATGRPERCADALGGGPELRIAEDLGGQLAEPGRADLRHRQEEASI